MRRTDSGSISRPGRSEEHTSELQSRGHLVCRLLLEKKNGRRSRRPAGGRAGPLTTCGKPTVFLVDIRKQYVMGHAPCTGDCLDPRVVLESLQGVSVD